LNVKITKKLTNMNKMAVIVIFNLSSFSMIISVKDSLH